MELVTFAHHQEIRLGALKATAAGDVVVDLNKADPGLAADMLALLNGGPSVMQRAARAVAGAPASATMPVAHVTVKAPIARPGKIMCIGLNYRDHAQETGMAIPDYPVLFAKYGNCVIGPHETVILPKISSEPDYEGELGVVIGKRAKTVAAGDALGYVAGYTCFIDVSARDFQHRTSQWTIGKTFDTFAPMGPALVTADEVGDPANLDIQLSIGGEVLQKSNTKHLIFPVADLVAYLSSVMTLEPGDVIATGTPSGVGAGRKPPRWLRPGEVMRVEISKVGVLENPVAAEA